MSVDAELDGWREDWQSGTTVPSRLGRGVNRQSRCLTDLSPAAMNTAAFVDLYVHRCRGRLLAVMVGAGLICGLGYLFGSPWLMFLAIVGVLVWYGWRIRAELAYFVNVRAQLTDAILESREEKLLPRAGRAWRTRRRRARKA